MSLKAELDTNFANPVGDPELTKRDFQLGLATRLQRRLEVDFAIPRHSNLQSSLEAACNSGRFSPKALQAMETIKRNGNISRHRKWR